MGKAPSQKLDQYIVRLPDGMRDKLKAAAAENQRSMNAEIVSRLDRYPSLGGEVDAMEAVARALAEAIDNAVGEDPDFLIDKVSDVFSSVDENGNVDRARILREWYGEASRRLKDAMAGTFHLSEDLLRRVEAVAAKEHRSVEAEVVGVLEREYPAPSDVMYIHLRNIRRALDLYERETDPRTRMRLQLEVEAMVTLGHNLEIDLDDEFPSTPVEADDDLNNSRTWEMLQPFIVNRDQAVIDALAAGDLKGAVDAVNARRRPVTDRKLSAPEPASDRSPKPHTSETPAGKGKRKIQL